MLGKYATYLLQVLTAFSTPTPETQKQLKPSWQQHVTRFKGTVEMFYQRGYVGQADRQNPRKSGHWTLKENFYSDSKSRTGIACPEHVTVP
jgi:hypothetical protein